MLEDDPSNMIYQFYEGREFFIKKQFHEAVRSLERAMDGLLNGLTGYFSETLKTLLSAEALHRANEVSVQPALLRTGVGKADGATLRAVAHVDIVESLCHVSRHEFLSLLLRKDDRNINPPTNIGPMRTGDLGDIALSHDGPSHAPS